MVTCQASFLPRCKPEASTKSSTESRNMRMRIPSLIWSCVHLPIQKMNFGW